MRAPARKQKRGLENAVTNGTEKEINKMDLRPVALFLSEATHYYYEQSAKMAKGAKAGQHLLERPKLVGYSLSAYEYDSALVPLKGRPSCASRPSAGLVGA